MRKKITPGPVLNPVPLAQGDTPGLPPAAGQARYRVGNTPILQGGVRFEPGSVIALPDTQAARLGLQPASD